MVDQMRRRLEPRLRVLDDDGEFRSLAEIRTDAILLALEGGLSKAQAARQFGISRSSINRLLAERRG